MFNELNTIEGYKAYLERAIAERHTEILSPPTMTDEQKNLYRYYVNRQRLDEAQEFFINVLNDFEDQCQTLSSQN